MPLTKSWRRFFVQEVSLVARTTEGLYREPSQGGTPVPYRARVEVMLHKVRNTAGEEVVADGTVYLMETPDVALGDLLILPDGSTPLVLAIDRPEDLGKDEFWYLSLHYGRDTRMGAGAG